MPNSDLPAWLIEQITRKPSLEVLFNGFCKKLAKQGLPIWRVNIGLETLHPADVGFSFVWLDGELTQRSRARPGILTSSDYLNSPARIVDETNRPFRWQLGEDDRGMEVLVNLRAEGMTGYVMLPLPFLDTVRSAALSFATRVPGGFTPAMITDLTAAATLLSPLAERIALRRVALDALTAYLGPIAAQRAYSGQIERGDLQTIRAAILISDLRNFTALSDRMERRAMVSLLDRWFAVLGTEIENHGGDILKFMGDGLLAVFPVGEDACAVCDRALDAALAALEGTERLNVELAAEGLEPLRFGQALHLGDVEFGNIGAVRRIDFTVIGPAVNQASRLQDQTKILATPIVTSATFAAAAGRRLRSLGQHALRGVAEPVEIFAPI